MAKRPPGVRRRSTGATISRIEKLASSRHAIPYLADDALRIEVKEISPGQGTPTVEYLTEQGVLPMVWRGRAMAARKLAGRGASAELVAALVDGHDPDIVLAGRPEEAEIVAAKQRKVAAFEASVSVTKSLSSLYAICGPEVRREVAAALDAASDALVAELDEACAATRIGGDTDRSWIDTEGLMVATVMHTSSRAGQPQLHVHFVIPHLQRDIEGTWRSIDSGEIYDDNAIAALWSGRVYRDEVARRLGLAWTEPTDGSQPELAWRSDGTPVIPPELQEHWSARSREIDAAAAELAKEHPGMHNSDLRRMAATASRQDKDLTEAPEDRPARWEAEADEVLAGTVEAVRTRLAAERVDFEPAPTAPLYDEDANKLADEIEESLTARHSVWDERELWNTVSEFMPAGWSRDHTRLFAKAVLEARALRAWSRPEGVEDGANRKRRPGTAYYSTRLTVELERSLDAWWYAAAVDTSAPIVDGDRREEAIIAAGLDDDKSAAQARLVRAICAGGNRVVSVVGPAGGGKTTMMRGVVEAAKVGHVPIAALATARQAANVLGKAAGCPATSVAMATSRPDEHLPRGGWWIVDEAAMVSTVDWERLRVLAEQRNAKIIAVGDPKQLGAITNAGWWAHVVTATEGAAADEGRVVADYSLHHLEKVYRFKAPWEGLASLRLRAGGATAAAALDEYAKQGRLWSRDNNRDGVETIAAASYEVIADTDAAYRDAHETHAAVLATRRGLREQLRATPRRQVRRRERLDADIEAATRRIALTRDARDEATPMWDATVCTTHSRSQAAAVNAAVRELWRRHRGETGPEITISWTERGDGGALAHTVKVGAGDIITTRRNDDTLIANNGRTVTNGDRWIVQRIDGTAADPQLLLRHVHHRGEIRIDRRYWAQDGANQPALIEGAWAATAHRTQGRTVRVGFAWASAGQTSDAAYVAATRGYEQNIAVAVGDVQTTLATAYFNEPAISALEAADREQQPSTGMPV